MNRGFIHKESAQLESLRVMPSNTNNYQPKSGFGSRTDINVKPKSTPSSEPTPSTGSVLPCGSDTMGSDKATRRKGNHLLMPDKRMA